MKRRIILFVVSASISVCCDAQVTADSLLARTPPAPTFLHRINQDLPKHGQLRFQSKEVYTPAHYTSKLGVICQQELKLDQRTPIAFRLRLGSVEACDFLEGKRKRLFP